MRLLIIGRLGGHITAASKIAIARGAKVAQVDDIDAGLNAMRAGQSAELVMVDVALDVGLLVTSLESERISVPVVAYGLDNDAEAAVAAIKAGAKEYIPLPPDPDLIAAVLEAVSEESDEIIFSDAGMADIIKLADRVAPSEASILITGESGTGKELMARHIHRKSKRAKQIFVSVNCAAIPENLLESELFGHEKGAFTGAVARRIGRFEEATGGTLLLDEVSEMEPHLQAKLLRAIQEREITRVGSNRPIQVDIRLIATTNRDLAEEAAKGTFREDLYFRLNVVNLWMPPLRSRRGDIAPLAHHFVEKYSDANGVSELPLSEAALQLLMQHQWRGNVRELENTVHRAVILANGDEIGTDAFQLTDMLDGAAQPDHTAVASAVSQVGTGNLVGHTVAEVERELILDTLNHCLGNRTHAATILGISIRTLRNKLKQYTEQGVPVPMPGDSAVA
ncbi:MAG: sigma-54-dependent Fis family transcriptional regulator [Alphaproteobacteria bacterium]|nr:sigma-54-dependent Fis family transcriptional regulator [Alphaproteobacteria bacterium]